MNISNQFKLINYNLIFLCESETAHLLYETGKEKRTCNIFFQIVVLILLYEGYLRVK